MAWCCDGRPDARERLEKLSIHLVKELDVLELQTKIHSRVQEELDKSQREYFLREQMKAIQRELGETEPQSRDVVDMRERIEKSGMPEPVAKSLPSGETAMQLTLASWPSNVRRSLGGLTCQNWTVLRPPIATLLPYGVKQ